MKEHEPNAPPNFSSRLDVILSDTTASPAAATREPDENGGPSWADFPWPAALGLEERRESVTYTPSQEDSTIAKARRRLGRWQSQAPFDDPEWRRQRFNSVGNASRWLDLLSTPAAPPASATRPPWVDRLASIYGPQDVERSAEPSHPLQLGGFAVLLGPLISYAADRLRRMLQGVGDGHTEPGRLLDSDEVLPSLCMILARRLQRLVSQALVLELRIAGLEERLAGETPEQRFEDFVRSLEDPHIAEQIFRQYPVLSRQLVHVVDLAVDRWQELLSRVTADHGILETFFGHNLGPLVGLTDSGGDPHRGGRRVYFLDFANGRRLVYKPRPMAVEAAFQDFLAWARERMADVPRGIQILDRGEYGFMEWLEPRTCESEAEVERFYRRQGALLAFLHLFGTTDLHLENVMAVGDSPMALDLETLLHPHFPRSGARPGEVGGLDDTVLRVGLLPNRLIQRGEEQIGLDASGLGAEVGDKTPKGGIQVQGKGTDEMRLVSTPGEIRSTPGRPTLRGEPVDPVAFADSVQAGFRSARQMLTQHRDELGADAGPLTRFRGLKTRVVLRPTHTYARLLSGASHPHLLGDAVDRDRHFDLLWLALQPVPWMEHVVDAECRDLRQGDIPYFSARTDSRRLLDGQDEDCGELLSESGFDGLMRRVSALSSSMTERQATIIHRTFELRAAEKRQRPRPRSQLRSPGPGEPSASRDEFLAAAFRAADRLRERAFVDSTGARWLVPRRLTAQRWALAEAGPDLYDGLSGVCLFLSYLAKVGGRAKDAELAEATAASLRHQLACSTVAHDQLKPVGAYTGWGGVLHTLCRLATLEQDPSWLDLAVDQLPRLEARLPEDRSFDVLGGSAGAALALCELARHRPQSDAALLARRCGEHLLQHTLPQPQGIGWPPPQTPPGHGSDGGASTQPLGGLSHGASGMAWALFELSRLAGLPLDLKNRFHATARDALAYEDTLFDIEVGNWHDVRPRPDGEKGFLAAWCHGAPGIGLSRLAILDSLGDDGLGTELLLDLRRDIERAITCTLDQGFGLTHSLCHGDLGNLDFLLELSQLSRENSAGRFHAEVERLSTAVLRSIEAQGFLFGTPGGTEPPGLLLGIAGIGYGLLRLAAPDQVPSILRLARNPGQYGSLLWSTSAELTLNRTGGNA